MDRAIGSLRYAFLAVALVCLAVFLMAAPSAQQTEYTNNFKFNSGQGVQPVFEGWSRAADGSVNFHFGYLNRNWVETPHIPVGPNNIIEPNGPDRGQPTFFNTRTQRNLFTVNVPKDWPPAREVIWTITVNGKTEKAFGWMQREWEIDPAGGAGGGGGNTDPERAKNSPPTAAIEPVAPVKLPGTAQLVVSVTDDGLPKPRGRGKPAVGQETPPTLAGGVDAPVNVPLPGQDARGGGGGAGGAGGAGGGGGGEGAAAQGLAVTWMVWRGPADVTFNPRRARVADGKATATATFTKPGEYVFRAVATDGQKTTDRQVKVTVQ
jgi:hypothetical protein